MTPADMVLGLPACGGWTRLALAVLAQQQADAERAERIKQAGDSGGPLGMLLMLLGG